jgi:hypothetical protein
MHVIESTLRFAQEYPKEFSALPEPYQNDDVLVYNIYNDGYITCFPKKDQVVAIGYWECSYSPEDNKWIEIPPHEP